MNGENGTRVVRLVLANISGYVCAFAMILSTALAACSEFGLSLDHDLTVIAPERPVSWLELPKISYRLSWRGADGETNTIWLDEGESAAVTVPRGIFQCFVLKPQIRFPGCVGSAMLRAAGILYPYGLSGKCESIRADWSWGYAASVAEALVRGGMDPGIFNLARLSETIADATSGFDPWIHPAEETAASLSQGLFRQDAFLKVKLFPVILPGPGPWYPESPFGELPIVKSPSGIPGTASGCIDDLSGQEWKVNLSSGIHEFISSGGKIVVKVGEEGNSFWVRLPGE